MNEKNEQWVNSIINSKFLRWDNGIWYLKDIQPEMEGVYDEEMQAALLRLEDRSWWFKHRNRIIETGIRAYPPQGGIIADVGGGNGFVSAHLLQQGFQIILFEPGFYGVKNAKYRSSSQPQLAE